MRATATAVVAALLATLVLSSGPSNAEATPMSIFATADAKLSSLEPNQAFGDFPDLALGTDSRVDGSRFRSLLTFDLAGVSGHVASARLHVFLLEGAPAGITVARTAAGWSEDGVTWASAPDLGDVIGTVSGSPTTVGWFDIKLDPDAIEPDGSLSVILDSDAAMIRLGSRETNSPPILQLQLTSGTVSSPAPTSTPTATPDASPASPPPSPTAAPTDAPTAAPTTAPTPVPTATATPGTPSGIPSIPAGYGQLLRKSFSDGSLAPFRILTYPNSHPGDLMIQYGRFVGDSAHVSVHDGYLDLRATRRSDGSWDQAFVGTGLTGDGTAATFKFQYGTARAMARMNTGTGAWQSLWYLVADSWGSPEIDWAEVIGSKLTANIHGSTADGQKASVAPFASSEWHEYGITKAPGYIAFLLDGREVGRANVSMSASMALLADAKVGLSAPDATTPSNLFLQVAWWTVDPL